MTAQEFKAKQSELGLSNADMARLCRVNVRTVERWRQGARKVPGPVIALIEICLSKH